MDISEILTIAGGLLIGWILYDFAKYCYRRFNNRIK